MSDEIRSKIGEAILNRFEITYQVHGVNYDPDTCWEAADDIIAVLVSELTDQKATISKSNILGPKTFTLDKHKTSSLGG